MLKMLFFITLVTYRLYGAGWDEYKSLFIATDGRVIDKTNNNITHSEAIGYALYFALKNNDTKTFKSVYRWYKNNLKKNKYGLIPWKWGEDKEHKWHILENNNATDGDLWIAYDSLLMYEKSKNEYYKQEALALLGAIKKNLLLHVKAKVFLLPAKEGFNKKESFEINLSYYLFFIFEKFQEYDNNPIWKQLQKDGITLLQRARFSPLKLHSDWISVAKKSLKISLGKNACFGYDALRIPLNILKSNMDRQLKRDLLQPYRRYVEGMKSAETVFGVVALKKGEISLYNYSYAHLSIYNMIHQYFNKTAVFIKEIQQLQGKNRDDYFAYSIYLFTASL